ncbi:MAG: hypothetical protein GF317_25045 [Candidatus Lokiarchaeota archaeon]|nr:hypothetical protein [Candidatus Lokiarchaeota archaeon]
MDSQTKSIIEKDLFEVLIMIIIFIPLTLIIWVISIPLYNFFLSDFFAFLIIGFLFLGIIVIFFIMVVLNISLFIIFYYIINKGLKQFNYLKKKYYNKKVIFCIKGQKWIRRIIGVILSIILISIVSSQINSLIDFLTEILMYFGLYSGEAAYLFNALTISLHIILLIIFYTIGKLLTDLLVCIIYKKYFKKEKLTI